MRIQGAVIALCMISFSCSTECAKNLEDYERECNGECTYKKKGSKSCEIPRLVHIFCGHVVDNEMTEDSYYCLKKFWLNEEIDCDKYAEYCEGD